VQQNARRELYIRVAAAFIVVYATLSGLSASFPHVFDVVRPFVGPATILLLMGGYLWSLRQGRHERGLLVSVVVMLLAWATINASLLGLPSWVDTAFPVVICLIGVSYFIHLLLRAIPRGATDEENLASDRNAGNVDKPGP